MRILIVEDEKKVAQFLKKGFQAEAYSVDTVPDGEEGLALSLRGKCDTIVLDVVLPGAQMQHDPARTTERSASRVPLAAGAGLR